MNMNDEQKPVVNTSYTVEKFDNEILLFSETGNQAVYLNDAAYAVWLLCKENMSVGQMINSLEEVYPDQSEQIRNDVLAALETLQANGVINITNE